MCGKRDGVQTRHDGISKIASEGVHLKFLCEKDPMPKNISQVVPLSNARPITVNAKRQTS